MKFLLTIAMLFAAALSSLARVKDGPEGIYCLMPFQQAFTTADTASLQSDAVWNLDDVEGIAARCAWGAIEPQEGVFDFTYFDQAFEQAARSGKKVSLSVTAGTFTPQWVYGAGAHAVTFTRNDGSTAMMPLPWDPVFQQKWFVLIKALGDRYDGRAQLTYVAMGGVGQQMEGYLAQTAADIQTFDTAGGQQKWLSAAKAIEDTYATAFPTTHVLYAIAPPTLDAEGAATMTKMVADCAEQSPRQFGIRSDGLRPHYAENGPVGLLLQQYAGEMVTGFQMSLPAQGQSLTPWFAIAEQMQADFVEVFHDDCTDPSEAGSLSEANAALIAIAQDSTR